MFMLYEKVANESMCGIDAVPADTFSMGGIYEALNSIRYGYYDTVCCRLRFSFETGV